MRHTLLPLPPYVASLRPAEEVCLHFFLSPQLASVVISMAQQPTPPVLRASNTSASSASLFPSLNFLSAGFPHRTTRHGRLPTFDDRPARPRRPVARAVRCYWLLPKGPSPLEDFLLPAFGGAKARLSGRKTVRGEIDLADPCQLQF